VEVQRPIYELTVPGSAYQRAQRSEPAIHSRRRPSASFEPCGVADDEPVAVNGTAGQQLRNRLHPLLTPGTREVIEVDEVGAHGARRQRG